MIRTYVKLNDDKEADLPPKVAEPDDSLECMYCEKQYLTHNLLRRHLDRDHPLYKPQLCDKCERVFYSKDALSTHMMQEHPQILEGSGLMPQNSNPKQLIDVLPPIAEENDAADATSGKIEKDGVIEEQITDQVHAQIGNDSDTVSTVNAVDSKEQNTKRKSSRLSRTRGRGSARDKEAAKEVLKDVLQTSILCDISKKKTPEREYICDFCVTGFFHQEGLVMHLINEHKVKPPNETSKDGSNASDEKSQTSTQGQYKCEYCDKFFHTKAGRSTHERGHEGNYIFEQTGIFECEAKKLGMTFEEYMEVKKADKPKEIKSNIETRSAKKRKDSNKNNEDPALEKIVPAQIASEQLQEPAEKKAKKVEGKSLNNEKVEKSTEQKAKKGEGKSLNNEKVEKSTEQKAKKGEGKQLKNPNRVLAFQWANAAKKAKNSKKRRLYRRKSIHFWELYQSEKRKMKLIEEALKSDDDVHEIEVSGECNKSSEGDSGGKKLEGKRRRVSFQTDSNKDHEVSEESMPDINYSEGRRRRKKREETNSDNDELSPKKRPRKSRTLSPKNKDREQNTNEDNSARNKAEKVGQNTDGVKRSPKKNYTTKDPRCKFDKDLLKEKTYSLRSSQIKKKSEDGDNSKDLNWEPNALDLSVSVENIDMNSPSKRTVRKKSSTSAKAHTDSRSSANKDENVDDSSPGQKKIKPTKSTKPVKEATSSASKEKNENDSSPSQKKVKPSKSVGKDCKKCTKTFMTNWEYRIHVTYCGFGSKPITCPAKNCGKVFQQKILFSQHFKFHHTNEPKDFVCKHCDGKPFVYSKTFNTHMSRLHTPNSEKAFMCDTCGKLFAKQWEYSNHRQNSHNVSRPYLCGLCKKSAFPTSARLKQHLQRCGKEKDLECDQCGKKFVLKYNFIRHVNETHRHDMLYTCPECGKEYQSEGGFYEHLRKKHGISRENNNTLHQLKQEGVYGNEEQTSDEEQEMQVKTEDVSE